MNTQTRSRWPSPYLIGTLLFLLLVLGIQHASARTLTLNVPDSGCITVRHLSVPGGNAVLDTFDASSFDSVQGPIWNFSGTCNTPPPPDGDPNQLKRASVTYHEGIVQNVDVTQFGNLWGRASAAGPIKPWPFAGGSEPLVTLPPGKHVRATMTVTDTSQNHALKGEMYASDHGSVYVRVYEHGQQIFYADHDGRGQPLDFNNNPWVYFTFGAQSGQKCKVVLGHTYEVEYGYVDPARGGRTRTHWN